MTVPIPAVADLSPNSFAAIHLRQEQLIALIETLTAKAEESRIELRLLRTELGMDNVYGRLPILETSVNRHESRMTKLEDLVAKLGDFQIESSTRQRTIGTIVSFVGGGIGGALISIVGRILIK